MKICVLKAGPAQRLICVVLALSMACGPSLNAIAQTPGVPNVAKPQAAEAPAGMIDTTYVPPGAVALAVLRPAQLMKSSMGELLPVEVATAAGLKYLGIDPANVDEVVGFVDMSNPSMPSYGLTLKFLQPLTGLNIPQELRAHTQPDQLNGKRYLKSQQPMLPSFYAPDKSTLVVAPDATLKRLVGKAPASKSSPIIDRVGKVAAGSDLYAVVDLATLRPFIQMGLAQAQQQMPAEAKRFADGATLVSAAELTVNISKPATTSFVVHANDAAAAEQVEGLLNEAVDKAREQMRADLAPQAASKDPVERAFAQYSERVSGRFAQPFMPVRKGAELTFFRIEGGNSPQQQHATVGVIGVLVALLLPAVQAAREAARRNVSMNNMKQIVLAMLIHEDAKKAYPAHAIYSKDGKPLLSWRVQILPYIEEKALYEQFHLDEPWDSEHNKALLPRMPKIFDNPNVNTQDGKTNYLLVVGKECAFDGSDKGADIRQIKDGTSRTIAVVEANADKSVEWTKPDDLHFDANNPAAGLGHLRPGGWIAAFLDGHIQFIGTSVDPNIVKAMFTKAGREQVGLP